MSILRTFRSNPLALVVLVAGSTATASAQEEPRGSADRQRNAAGPGPLRPARFPVRQSSARRVRAGELAACGLAVPPAAGMPKCAFVVEMRIGGGGLVQGSGSNGVLQPSLFVGARLFGRVHLGLGFGLLRVSLGGELLNPLSDTETSTVFDVEPSASVDLFQARDRRVAFYVKAGSRSAHSSRPTWRASSWSATNLRSACGTRRTRCSPSASKAA